MSLATWALDAKRHAQRVEYAETALEQHIADCKADDCQRCDELGRRIDAALLDLEPLVLPAIWALMFILNPFATIRIRREIRRIKKEMTPQ